MKRKHVPAGFEDKPCLEYQRINGKKTGYRCTKAAGHRKSEKEPFGDIHAAIGVGTVFSDNRIDIAGMNDKNASDYMATLIDKGNAVVAAWSDKKRAA